MKIIWLACFFFGFSALPAFSLPGQSYDDARDFVFGHEQLHLLTQSDEYIAAYSFHEPDLVLISTLVYDEDVLEKQVIFDILSLMRIGQNVWQRCRDLGLTWSTHCLKVLEYPDVWQRDSPIAQALLTRIYGTELAQDFAAATFVYQSAAMTERVYRGKLYTYVWTETSSDGLRRPSLYLYAGKHAFGIIERLKAESEDEP